MKLKMVLATANNWEEGEGGREGGDACWCVCGREWLRLIAWGCVWLCERVCVWLCVFEHVCVFV